jgi:hypothetical protein
MKWLIKDKKKIKNWKENDIFAILIKNSNYPKYNGKYLILINKEILLQGWVHPKNVKLFHAKIVDKIPTDLKELEAKEYIKTSSCTYLSESFRNPLIKIEKDKFNYIYTNLFEIKFSSRKIPEEMIYLGNYNLSVPQDEYIPNTRFWGTPYYEYEHLTNLVDLYHELNLRESHIFQEKSRKEIIEKELEEIEFCKQLQKLKTEQKDIKEHPIVIKKKDLRIILTNIFCYGDDEMECIQERKIVERFVSKTLKSKDCIMVGCFCTKYLGEENTKNIIKKLDVYDEKLEKINRSRKKRNIETIEHYQLKNININDELFELAPLEIRGITIWNKADFDEKSFFKYESIIEEPLSIIDVEELCDIWLDISNELAEYRNNLFRELELIGYFFENY